MPSGVQTCADRKSTRLNSSHGSISYAVFCLKKKKQPVRQSVSPVWLRGGAPAPVCRLALQLLAAGKRAVRDRPLQSARAVFFFKKAGAPQGPHSSPAVPSAG